MVGGLAAAISAFCFALLSEGVAICQCPGITCTWNQVSFHQSSKPKDATARLCCLILSHLLASPLLLVSFSSLPGC